MIKFNKEDYTKEIAQYDDDAMQYCLDVLEGRILAGELIQYACLRHLKDLKRITTDDSFVYKYDAERAKGMIKFAELIPDINTGKYRPLAGFQKFILSEMNGWGDPTINGSRFKTNSISMARANGKTDIASWVALREFLMGQPKNTRQIIVASLSVSQTDQLYSYIRKAWNALKKTPYFATLAKGIDDNSQEMRISSQNTRLVKLSAESKGGGNSYHPSLIILDEFHTFTDRSFVDSLTSGNIMNANARFIYISTSGVNVHCPMAEDYTNYSEKLKNGTLDDTILFLCWEQDSDKEAYQPETYMKSNPLYEVPSRAKVLANTLPKKRAEFEANGDLPKFLVYQMNRWQNAQKNAYIPLDLLNKSISNEPFSFDNRDVYIGYDASLSNDDTSLVFVFPYVEGTKNKYYVYQHSWIPTRVAGGINAKMKADSINYERAETEGFATITKNRFGNIDQDEVYHWMLDFVKDHNLNVQAIGYDAWGTGSFIRSLDELEDWNLFPIRQGARSLSEPTKFVQDQFTEGNIIIPDDRVLKACLSNAVLTDKDNQLLIDKNRSNLKIDAVDALIDAMYQGMLHFTPWTNEKVDKNDVFHGMNNDQINDYFHNDFTF
jgi:phage terminase large subunit-like protein